MNTLMCTELNNGNAAHAHVRVDVRTALAISTSWEFATKPYAYQRPSGAPPG